MSSLNFIKGDDVDDADADVILACKEFRCAWDHKAAWFVATTRTGKRCWQRKVTCLRGCGSHRIDRVTPSGLFEIISRAYWRPQLWRDVGNVYFSKARRERIALFLAQDVEVQPLPEDEAVPVA